VHGCERPDHITGDLLIEIYAAVLMDSDQHE
jgi:hypothetical protein